MSLLRPPRSSRSHDRRHPVGVHPVGREALDAWVDSMTMLMKPDQVVWCDGSDTEWNAMTRQMVADGQMVRLNDHWRPNSFLARSSPRDVARVEERTFICSEREEDAGATNNWRSPDSMREELRGRFDGVMRGRTLYVVPFSMGPVGGAISQLGVQLTDSPYAVVSMSTMTRMGSAALAAIGDDAPWVPAVHSVGVPLVDEYGVRSADQVWPQNDLKIIAHFPETREIWSYGSGYGGNALLAKKCFALRIASVMARDEGWLAEHMLLIKVTSPEGTVRHIAAAFPSACGKTNFAMLQPTLPDWKVETIGDDIAWLRPGADGRLYAINPEAGLFGVAPGTGESTNPSAMATIWGNTIFTNVALREDGDVWWEGMTDSVPDRLTDWRGEPWTRGAGTTAAHPNGRFTVSLGQCPTVADDWDSPDGVPIDAIIFGGRRASNVPLVAEAADWTEGVFMGATIASEQTAAAEGPVGALRFDPFAMLPFCGYNMADYWAHWLSLGETLGDKAPKVFRVNWFRKGTDGRYLWPGFGDNVRVLDWILARLDDEVQAVPTPVGGVPQPADLDLQGLDLAPEAVEALLEVDAASWLTETDQIAELFARFGDRVPADLTAELARLRIELALHG